MARDTTVGMDENTQELSARVTPALLAEVDGYAASVAQQCQLPCSRAEAVRILLKRALREMNGKGLAKARRSR